MCEGSGCVIESIDGEYVSVSSCSPLSGSPYSELPYRIKNSKKARSILKLMTISAFFGVILGI